MANAHDTIMFVTNRGILYWLKVYKIPEASRTAIGKAVVNLINKEQDEKIMATITTADFDSDKSLVFFTKNGIVKRTNLSEYGNVRSVGIRAINLDDGDEIVTARITTTQTQNVLIATYNGYAIKFPLDKIREQGRVSRGVTGIKFKAKNDFVVGAICLESEEDKIFSVSEQGIGKQTLAKEYRITNRGGKGIIAMKLNERTGNLVNVLSFESNNLDLMLLTSSGKMIRVETDKIRDTSRNTSGVKLIALDKKDKVVHISQCQKEEKDLEDDGLESNKETNENNE